MAKRYGYQHTLSLYSQLSRTGTFVALLLCSTALSNCSTDKENARAISKGSDSQLTQDTLRGPNTMHPSAKEMEVLKEKSAPVTFTPAQTTLLNEGLAVAGNCVKDTVFINVLREQAKANKIEWGKERLSAIEARYRAAPTDYLLAQYAERGLQQFTDLVAVQWTRTDVTSSVVPCEATMYVNVNALNRSASSVAGTFVHERAHVFCHKHNENDVSKNECDFAYQAGDLAWILGLYRAHNSEPITKPPYVMCDDLVKKLKKRNIIK